MSVTFETYNGSFIDHREYTNNLYTNVQVSEQIKQTFTLNSKLFCILVHTINNRRKRDRNVKLEEEISAVKQMYEKFSEEIPSPIKAEIYKKYNLLDTGSVRDLAKNLFETTVFDYTGINGGNNLNAPLKCEIKEKCFLIPQKCRFLCGCVKEQCKKLNGTQFDIIVADPPWWNKFIRRLKSANENLSYKMMYNEDIASIPVRQLLAPNCLVAVWCTNAPSNIAAVKDVIFPAWGVTYVTTWYWMKVTIQLEPLCPFGTGHRKQPYERLIIGKVGQLKEVPKTHMFMSVPSALHSHKPPLIDLLSPYVDVDTPRVLELFARYLLPNTTSVGFEPLKWQHLSLYETVS